MKLLRAILSPDPQNPIPQPALAARIGTTAATVKMIEAGRQRTLGESLSARIADSVGARWDEGQGRWVFAYPPNDAKNPIPFSHELFDLYRSNLEAPPRDKAGVAKWTARKLQMLLVAVDDARFYPLLFQVERAMSRWAEEFRVAGTVPELPGDEEWNQLRAGALLAVEVAEYLRQARTAFAIQPTKLSAVQFVPIPGGIADSPEMALRGHSVIDPGRQKPGPAKGKKAKPRRRPG